MAETVVVKIRVMAPLEAVVDVAQALVLQMEGVGFEAIETSQAYACRPPQADQGRVYVTLIKRQEGGK